MFKNSLKTLAVLFAGLAALQGQVFASPYLNGPQHIIECGVDANATALTVYVSPTPRIYSQTLTLKYPGTFIVTASADGFSFEGHAYARSPLTGKWDLVAKSPTGQKTWARTWRVKQSEAMSDIQMRMIKDDNGCRDCTITVNVRSECL